MEIGKLSPEFKFRHKIVPRRVRGRVNDDKPLAPMNWAQRLKRVFSIDIKCCPECGGRVRVIACIEDPALIRKILDHVQRSEARINNAARGPPAMSAAGAIKD